jgi:hypothetical protein
LNHALLNEDPSGGTPTFLGLDAGLELLTNSQYNGRRRPKSIDYFNRWITNLGTNYYLY